MKYLFFVLPLFSLWSCGPDIECEEELLLQDDIWSYQDSLVAEFNVADTNAVYNIHLILEHSTNFPYQNFYIKIHNRFPDGQELSEQLSLELAASAGVWLGDCDSQQCVLDIPIQAGVYFNQLGDYRVLVEQFSRRELLPGIEKVIFKLEKTAEKRN